MNKVYQYRANYLGRHQAYVVLGAPDMESALSYAKAQFEFAFMRVNPAHVSHNIVALEEGLSAYGTVIQWRAK